MTALDRITEEASYSLQRWLSERIYQNDTQAYINDDRTHQVLDRLYEYVVTRLLTDDSLYEAFVIRLKNDLALAKEEDEAERNES